MHANCQSLYNTIRDGHKHIASPQAPIGVKNGHELLVIMIVENELSWSVQEHLGICGTDGVPLKIIKDVDRDRD